MQKKIKKRQRVTSEKGNKRGKRGKSGGESAIGNLNRQNIITENKSKKRICLVSVTNAKPGNLNSSEAAFNSH